MAVGFHEVQFPTDISAGATGGPGFHTTILTLASGAEQRNIDWSRSRATYDVTHAARTEDQMDALIAFFFARRGRAYGFRFKDYLDFSAIEMPIATNVDGNLQLTKVYTDAVNSTARWITKPVTGSVTFSRVGIVLDYTSGLCTGTAVAGDTWTGEFDVPVRFDTDDLQGIKNGLVSDWNDIKLIEVRI